MSLQLRFVPEKGAGGQSMLIRMMQPSAGRSRLRLGYIGMDELNRLPVYIPVASAAEFHSYAEILDLRPDGYPDRYVMKVRGVTPFGTMLRTFVFAGARIDGIPVSFTEKDIWSAFLGDVRILVA